MPEPITKAAKKKPPSRVKYEKSHPTVSCRVPLALYLQLAKAGKETGTSFAGFLKMGMGDAEAKAKYEETVKKKARQAGYRACYQAGYQTGKEAGYKAGFAEAKGTYLVTYECSECGKAMEVTSEDEKAVIAEFMYDQGWHHTTCPSSS